MLVPGGGMNAEQVAQQMVMKVRLLDLANISREHQLNLNLINKFFSVCPNTLILAHTPGNIGDILILFFSLFF